MNYRRFKVDTKAIKYLSREDKRILKILEEVVKDTAMVYEMQVRDGFYSRNIPKEEIEKASKKNSLLLSPFTFVEFKNGEIKSIPFHQKYAKQLSMIADKIDKASNICTNPPFKKYLKARANSLREGSFKEADIAWLNVKNSSIDFSIGPFERYLDKMFFIKRVFQAHVGVVDKSMTEMAKKMKEALYSSAKMSPEKYHSTNIPKRGVHIFVEGTPATAGYMADVLFSGEHFPSDLDIMQRFGAKIVIYSSQLGAKFDKLYYPIFKIIFEKRFAAKYSRELLMRGIVYNVLLYELGKQLHKFEGARGRLKELYGPIDEANGFASGIQHSKSLVIKGLISQDELEAIIITHVLWMFTDWVMYQYNKGKESHIIGNSMLLNSYLENGALTVQRGISWPNFPKLFFDIEDMADKLVHLLRGGTYKEAEEFIKKYADVENFEVLGKSLKNIPANI